jgi:hypothetical protein
MPHAGVLRLHRDLLALRRDLLPGAHVQALDEDTMAVRRQGRTSGELLLITRLRSHGTVEVTGATTAGAAWRPALTTEDSPFAGHGRVPRIRAGWGRATVQFSGPAAVLFRG